MAFANVITGELFELICTYLHFTGTESIPTYQGPSKLFTIYFFGLSFEQKISIPVTSKPELMKASSSYVQDSTLQCPRTMDTSV